MRKKIEANISIEELVEILPGSVTYLSRKGIKCIACGEPIWGTLREAAEEKGFGQEEIQGFLSDLNSMAGNK
jgi:hypothetical protein